MKKTFVRILSLILTVIVLAVPVLAATEPTTFITSNDKDSYIKCEINGSNVTISGKIAIAGLEQVWLRTVESTALGPSSKIINLGTLDYFSETLPVSTNSVVPVQIFVKTSYSNGNFMGFIYNMIDIKNSSGKYVFKLSPVYDANVEKMSKWTNPNDFLLPADLSTMSAFEAQYYISYERLEAVHTSKEDYVGELSSSIGTIRTLADKIIGSETDTYEIIRKLSNWVSENIYYDYDYLNGRSSTIYYYPLDVIREKRSICDGYCRLLNALLRSKNIPSRIITTYSLTIGGAEEFDGLKHEANHAIVTAYYDGRWILLDPTWDSGNVYEYGEFKKSPMVASYFDVSLEKLSATHEFIDVPCSSDENAPSSWAQPEVKKAIENSLVPNELQKNYRSSATREQFCTLVMNMLIKYTGAGDINALLAKYGKTMESGMFSDSDNSNVLAAAILGIVNGTGEGKFSPSNTLTREQAATMLSRAADVLSIKSSGEGLTFADDSGISAWAKDAVKFISSLTSSENSKVMGGVGDNKFSPKGSYTIEQSILTCYRLFMCK